jgi:hypothetical protein
MPFRLSIPLPGPFSYSRRIGGGKGSGQALLFWLLIGWWLIPSWLPLKWTVLGLVWLAVFGSGLARGDRRPPQIRWNRS